MRRFLYFVFLLFWTVNLLAQNEKKLEFEPAETVSNKRSVTIDGEKIDYTVTTGYLTLQSEYGEEKAHIFYVAYTRNKIDNTSKRPLTFSFNGGPGSSSVWMHLGMLGPKRIKTDQAGNPTAVPYDLVDNPHSWLDLTDLIFIDPISTGYSRANTAKENKDYHGFSSDIASIGDFIRRYINDNQRWGSPKYLIGESYGTIRAAALSNHLIDKHNLFLNGTILVSYVNNFQTLSFSDGNELPYPLFLPSYAATAYYHQKLGAANQQKPLEQLLNEVENFAATEYNAALFKGSAISQEEEQNIATTLSELTGLDKSYILNTDLRINIHHFRKQLLNDSLTVVGRFDSRYTAKHNRPLADYAEIDPSYSHAVHGAFSTMINDYLTRDLGFKTTVPYEILTSKVWPWDYSNVENRFLDVTDDLRKALVKNKDLKIWVANGYYDLATPYFATKYTIDHINLTDQQRSRVTLSYHDAGHMMYLHIPSLREMKSKATQFYLD